jgi:hypothetical protein
MQRQDENVVPSEGLSGTSKVDLLDLSIPTETSVKQATTQDLANSFQTTGQIVETTQVDLENEFMRRASAYVDALPDTKEGTVQLIKIVSKKLRGT